MIEWITVSEFYPPSFKYILFYHRRLKVCQGSAYANEYGVRFYGIPLAAESSEIKEYPASEVTHWAMITKPGED